MFNYSSEVEWIQVADVSGGQVWINLAKVDCISENGDGTTTIYLTTKIVRSTMPFDQVLGILTGEDQ